MSLRLALRARLWRAARSVARSGLRLRRAVRRLACGPASAWPPADWVGSGAARAPLPWSDPWPRPEPGPWPDPPDDGAGSASGFGAVGYPGVQHQAGSSGHRMRDRGTRLRRKGAHDLREPRNLPVEASRQPAASPRLGHRLRVGIVDRAGKRRRARNVAGLDELAELIDPFREGIDRELVVEFIGEHVEPHLLDAALQRVEDVAGNRQRRRPPSRRSRSPPTQSSRRGMPARARPSATAVGIPSDRCRASGRRID